MLLTDAMVFVDEVITHTCDSMYTIDGAPEDITVNMTCTETRSWATSTTQAYLDGSVPQCYGEYLSVTVSALVLR